MADESKAEAQSQPAAYTRMIERAQPREAFRGKSRWVQARAVASLRASGTSNTPEANQVAPPDSASLLLSDLEAMPDDAMIPIRFIRQRLGALTKPKAARLLSVDEYGARCNPQRSCEWVREQCRVGTIAGASKSGKSWLIPEDAVVAVQARRKRQSQTTYQRMQENAEAN